MFGLLDCFLFCCGFAIVDMCLFSVCFTFAFCVLICLVDGLWVVVLLLLLPVLGSDLWCFDLFWCYRLWFPFEFSVELVFCFSMLFVLLMCLCSSCGLPFYFGFSLRCFAICAIY